MQTLQKPRRLQRRAAKRGAAMVEAIVIIGVMLVFMGMNIWAYKAYGGKVDQMNSVRRDALFYASHNCEKRLGEDNDMYTVEELRGNNATGGSSMNLMGIINTILRGQEFDFFGTARSTKGPTQVAGTALTRVGSDGVTRSALRTEVKTASAVSCNEKPLGEGIMALLNMGWQFVKSLF